MFLLYINMNQMASIDVAPVELSPREQYEQRTGPYLAAKFGRVITAMATPFNKDGKLDLDAAKELADHLQENGSEGLVIAGTTGESSVLSEKEHLALIEAVYDAVEIPVLAGTGSNSTEESIRLTDSVVEGGYAEGLLVVSPYYNRPPQDGIIDYFTQVARAASGMPVVMYDIPVRTGRGMAIDTILYLANEVENIVGLKDAAGKPEQTEAVIQGTSGEFMVWSGEDKLNRKLFLIGAVGAVSVASHWAGVQIRAMYDALQEQDFARAEAIDAMLQRSYAFESSEATPNPIPAKAMMRRILGERIGRGRSPMVIREDTERKLEKDAEEVLRELNEQWAQLNAA